MSLRLRSDWLRVVLEPERVMTRGGILFPHPAPVRIARVVAAGPGKRTPQGVLIPMELKPGDRFPFFKAVTETRSGRALAMHLGSGEALVRQSDVLFVIDEGDVEVTL